LKSGNSMKVLLVDNSLDSTGASKALVKTISEVRSPDIGFVFLFPKNSKCVEATEKKGFKTYTLKLRELSKRVSNVVLYFPTLFVNTFKASRIIKNEKITIVHANDIYNMLGVSLKLFSRVKLITHIRRMPESFPSIFYKTWSRLHLKYADHIIAVSAANKNALPANNKTTVIYDPLPDEEELPVYVPRPKLENSVNILYLANYTEGKGHRYALEILQKALRENKAWNFSLNFYGGEFGMKKNSDYKRSLVKLSQENGLSSIVVFKDKTTRVEETMKQYDLVMNLSDSESFSRVTLEALFYGIPVIATDVGGTREMVINEETGILVPPKVIPAMYEGFMKLISDDHLRVQLSQNAYKYVRYQFGKRNTVDKLVDVYRRVIQQQTTQGEREGQAS
jgi:L-malate glycosyltransferase